MSPYRVRRDAKRRVDASMNLLTSLYDEAVDPEYAHAGAKPGRRPRWWLIGILATCFGLMVGTAVAGTIRSQPVLQQERVELLARVRAAETRQDQLRTQVNEVAARNRELGDAALQADPETARIAAEVARLDLTTGMRAVSGPGVVLVVDDAETGSSGSRVVDVDLRQAVNGLWRSGAEAIAINGHRLSSRTSIRGAGNSITVDYRSLIPPYRIEAIGDSAALLQRFPASPGGAWWAYLRQNFDIRYELTSASALRLDADPGLTLRYASQER